MRKLKPYFQAHTIIVLMDQPLKRVMSSPEAAGQISKQVLSFVQISSLIDNGVIVRETNSKKNWTTSLIAYLRSGILPDRKVAARKLKVQASWFVLIRDVLYKRGFS